MQDVIESIKYTWAVLMDSGDVREVRTLGNKLVYSGYFSDEEELVNQVLGQDGKSPGIYITLNPVNMALLARAENRLRANPPSTTSDKDIVKRRWIVVDIDPVRPSNISSSDSEHEAALGLAKTIQQHLCLAGFPTPVLADSGNGAHLLFFTDLPNDADSTALVKAFLERLSLQFSTNDIHIDTSVYNASRITRLYGTMTCKGDSITDRPHRRSGIIDCPKNLTPTKAELLHDFIKPLISLHSALAVSPGRARKNQISLDVEQWLTKHDIQIASSGPWQKGKKYVLHTCPWNPEHTDRSAYVVQLENGAIAAGCHHNSCDGQGWKQLRALYDTGTSTEGEGMSEDRRKHADILLEIAEDVVLFHTPLQDAYGSITLNGITRTLAIKGSAFELWLTKQFYDFMGTPPDKNAVTRALSVLQAKAVYDGELHQLNYRVAELDGKYHYDLTNDRWETVVVAPDTCEVTTASAPLFMRRPTHKPQVTPSFPGDLHLLLRHIPLKDAGSQILLLVYVVACLIALISHPVLVLVGPKGSAKSTTMKMLRSLLDPAENDALSMPRTARDLVLALANSYVSAFDNLETLSEEQSNLLCIAATGGTSTARRLFTDTDESVIKLHGCSILNGINVAVTRADLLDRAILLNLDRISSADRKEEKQVWEDFNRDKASILGGAFTTLSKALSLEPTIPPISLTRMADFTRWGFVIAEALELGGDNFLKAYNDSLAEGSREAIANHPVASALVALLANTNKWSGTITELLHALGEVASRERISTLSKLWPTAPNYVTRRLNEVRSDLQEIGINYEIKHMGAAKVITLVRE